MPKIRSAPLAGIQDQAILNALRVMQENIEALAGASNSAPVPVTEELLNSRIGALNESIASLRKQLGSMTSSRGVSSSGGAEGFSMVNGGLATDYSMHVRNYLVARDGIQTDGWMVAGKVVSGGVDVVAEIAQVQRNLEDFAKVVGEYMAAHP